MFFSVGDVFFTDFSFEVFLSNLPLLPFTSIFAPFSEPHQAVIFVLGAKVTPGLYGKARSSLLFSGKISSPSGSIFPKNLAFPNPYLFKHPKRKRPMRQKVSREEKDWLTRNVNSNTYFKSAVPLQGWMFDFSDILRTYIVKQYGHWAEYKATDKTALRSFLYGRIDSIVELNK